MQESRKYVPIQKAAEVAGAYDFETNSFSWSLVEIENMGWCKDGCTRWYWFLSEDGVPCYTLRRGDAPKYSN